MADFDAFPLAPAPTPPQGRGDPWEAFPLAPQGDAPPPQAEAAPDDGFTWSGLLTALPDGVREGVAMAAGAPVDIVNNIPRIANILPGEQGFTTISDNPVGGSRMIDDALRLGGVLPDYEPRNAPERFANRIGQEIGATAVPLGGAAASTAGRSVREINRMAAAPKSVAEGLWAQFVQPLKVNPIGALSREGAYAAAAGAGAQAANETFGEGVLPDTLGSIAGTGALALATGGARALWNLFAAASGSPKFRGGVVDETVADRLMNNSERLASAKAMAPNSPVDSQPLADALRRRAPVEDAVPGYRANAADRANDAGLATLTYNVDAANPGAANVRRSANDAAVNARVADMAPDGIPARARADIQSAVDAQIAEALSAEDVARVAAEDAAQGVAPTMPTAQARGSAIRSGLEDAYFDAQQGVRSRYDALNSDGTLVDPRDLRSRAAAADAGLAPNDAKRFRPPEADTIAEMPDGGEPVRLSDILATRSGLTDDTRAARAAGQNQAARIGDKYVSEIDDYLNDVLPPEQRAQFDDARAARRDVGERFERPGTANADVLRTRQGGSYALDDSAVGPRYAQPDSGKLSDLDALLREAGTDPRVREGLADTVLADVQGRGLLQKPDALRKYLGERDVLLGEFPELRTKLEAAGMAADDLATASRAARDTEKRLTTPGRSPEASYLKYGDDRVLDSVRTVTNAADPRAAARQLVESAGTPTAVQDLRAALWEEVKNRGKLSAQNSTGGDRWNGRVLRDLFEDPKFSAVAEELWADDPEDLANIKKVFTALAGAEGSIRAKAPGTSGTGQAVTGGYDPALTTSAVASRARSVNRGQLSPTIAVVDVAATWLRRKSAQVQSRAIDQLTAEVVNNPGMAADLLERYNPATAGAFTRMMTQKYGTRASTLLNILDDAANDEEDPLTEALE